MCSYIKAVTEKVTDTEHPEREAFGVSFLCYPLGEDLSRALLPNTGIPKSKQQRSPALKDRVVFRPKEKNQGGTVHISICMHP